VSERPEFSWFLDFPPVGQALVGPNSKYERTPDGVVRATDLPHDPNRTWRVVPSTEFAPDGTPRRDGG